RLRRGGGSLPGFSRRRGAVADGVHASGLAAPRRRHAAGGQLCPSRSMLLASVGFAPAARPLTDGMPAVGLRILECGEESRLSLFLVFSRHLEPARQAKEIETGDSSPHSK